jgi:hypothetical protein
MIRDKPFLPSKYLLRAKYPNITTKISKFILSNKNAVGGATYTKKMSIPLQLDFFMRL